MDTTSKDMNIFAKLFFGLIAIWAVPIYQGGKWLVKKAFDGFWGFVLALFVGLPLSIAGGIIAGNYVGWKSYPAVESWFQSWIPNALWGPSDFCLHYGWAVVGVIAGVLAWWVLMTYVWSIVYLVGIKWVIKAADKVRIFSHKIALKYYARGEEIFLSTVKTVFQPSSLWSTVQERNKERVWAKWLIEAIGGLSLIATSCYLGWQTLIGVQTALAGSLGLLAWLPAFLVAYFVVFTVGPFLNDLLEHARLSFTAVICGGATAYALLPFTGNLIHFTQPQTASYYATYIGIFVSEMVAVVAYVFPGFYLLISGGLIKKILDALEKLFDTVLDEKRTNFRRLFHEVVTFVIVYRFTTLSLLLWGLLGLPTGWSIVLAVLVAGLTYVLIGELFEVGSSWSIGNTLIGVLAAAHLGGKVGVAYAAHNFVFGTWGAIFAGLVVFLTLFCVPYPLLYKGARFVCDLTGISYLGVPLSWLHEKAWKAFRRVMEKFEKVYERGYWDDRKDTCESDYRKLFLHVVNLVVSPVAGFIGGAVGWHALGLIPILAIPVGLLTAFLAYLLLGQVVLKGRTYGIGVVASLIGGSLAGVLAYGAVHFDATAHKLYVAVPVGILASDLVFWFLFPAGYIVLRWLTSWSTDALLPLVGGIYDACWKVFDRVIWQPFLVVYRFVRDYMWKPVWHLFVRFWAAVWSIWLAIWNGVKNAWDGMFGHKNSA